jgi:chorismate mutase
MQLHHPAKPDASANARERVVSIEDLAGLRARIDAIDEEIVALLAARFAVTGQVGKLKAALGLAATDTERETGQTERYRQLAEVNALNPRIVNQVFRLIIEEVVSNHQRVASVLKE